MTLSKLPIRILLGAVAIMAVSTLIGIIHNAVRSRPMPLVPDSRTASPLNESNTGELKPESTDAESSHPAIVTVEQVKSMLDDPYAFIIDARSEEEFGEGHIPGALNIPYDRFVEFYNYVTETIPMDARVVCYCRSVTCDFSDHLSEELKIAGYENVSIFRDGWDAWIEAENEVER
jgi:rhodanese-related sulfurtransferase